jgi:RNA polymerase sigma-70 factor, ECF subfamily
MTASDLTRRLENLLPRLRRFARALTASPQDAEDLVQSAVVRALENPIAEGSDLDLQRWLFRVARNLWIDELRSAERRLREPNMREDWETDVAAATHDSELQQRLTEVDAAMKQIPPDLREVLVYVCVEGYSYQETAELMGIPVGTVMSRLSRARVRLAELMK